MVPLRGQGTGRRDTRSCRFLAGFFAFHRKSPHRSCRCCPLLGGAGINRLACSPARARVIAQQPRLVRRRKIPFLRCVKEIFLSFTVPFGRIISLSRIRGTRRKSADEADKTNLTGSESLVGSKIDFSRPANYDRFNDRLGQRDAESNIYEWRAVGSKHSANERKELA